MAQTIQFNIETNTGQSTQSIAQLKQEFESINQYLENAEQGTDEFSAALRRAGDVKGKIDELNASIDALRPQKQFETIAKAAAGMVGGFQAVTGAVQLFGVENEELLESLQRVNALMAITQGLKAFGESIVSVKALKTQLTTLLPSLAGATKGVTGFGTALKLTGIGLVISAVAYLITNFDELKESVTDLFPELGSMSTLFGKVVDISKGVGSALLQFVATPIRVIINLIKGDFEEAANAFANGMNVIDNASQSYYASQEERANQHRIEMIKIEVTRLEDARRILEAEGKSTVEITRRIYALKLDIAKGNADELRSVQTESAVFEAKLRTDSQRQSEMAAQERSRMLQEQSQRRLAIEKELNDKLELYRRERELSEMGELERSLALISDKYNDDLQLLIKNGKDKTDLEFIIESEKQKIRDDFKQRELDAQKRANEERIKLEQDYRNEIIKQGADEVQKLDTQYETRYFNLQQSLDAGKISEQQFRNDVLTIGLQSVSDNIQLNYDRLMNEQVTYDEFIKIQNNLLESRRQLTNAQIELNKAVSISEEEKYAIIAGALSSVSQLIGETTVAGKALAIAGATIDTYRAGTLALASYPPPFGAIALAATIAQGLATVRKIIGVKVPNSSSSGVSGVSAASVAPPKIQQQAASVTQTILSDRDYSAMNRTVRAIVVETDITKTQNRVKEIQGAAKF